MIDGHGISPFSTAPFGVFTTSTQDAKMRRHLCACAVNLSDENRMLHSIVAELSTSLAKMQTMYALQSQVLRTQQELIIALGTETTVAGRAAPLPARAESPSFDDPRSVRAWLSMPARQSSPVAPPIRPLMVLAESAVMESREGRHGKREASQALYGEDKRQRYA